MKKNELLKQNNLISFSNEIFTINLNENLFDTLKSNNESITLDLAKKMVREINDFEHFSKNKKSKKVYFSGNNQPFIYLLPYLFSSIKESYYWNRKASKLIQPNDVDTLDFSEIHIIKWPSDLTKFEIVEELRNAIQHGRIVYNKNDTIFIDNPLIPKKHPFNFKASIPYIFFNKLIYIITSKIRRFSNYNIDENSFSQEDLDKEIDFRLNIIQNAIGWSEYDRRWEEYPYNDYDGEFMGTKWYKSISHKIKLNETILKDSLREPINTKASFTESYDYIKRHQNIICDESYDIKSIELTDNQKQIINDFFSIKWHKLSAWEFQYITDNLVENVEQNFISFIHHFWKADEYSKYYDIIYDFCEFPNLHHEIMSYYSINKTEPWKYEIINKLIDNVIIPKQEHWLPLIFQNDEIIYKLIEDLKILGFKYNWENHRYEKWDFIFTIPDFFGIYRILMEYWTNNRHTVNSFKNRLKIMFAKVIYINFFWNLIDKTSEVVWGISEAEHIRNALVHNTYTFLDGINYTILRDWYNKKTNTWSWEKKFNINDIYQKCVDITMKD